MRRIDVMHNSISRRNRRAIKHNARLQHQNAGAPLRLPMIDYTASALPATTTAAFAALFDMFADRNEGLGDFIPDRVVNAIHVEDSDKKLFFSVVDARPLLGSFLVAVITFAPLFATSCQKHMF
jgi:hypothetical protein